MTIKGIKKKRSMLMILIGAFAIFFAVSQGIKTLDSNGWVLIFTAAVILVLMFYELNIELSRKGVDEITSFLGIIKKHKVTPWEDFRYIHADFKKSKPNVRMTLRMAKGEKTVVVEESAVQRIFDWAADGNPKVIIEYNSPNKYNVANMKTMSKDEYNEARNRENVPQNFHELANEARKIKQKWADDAAQEERRKLLQRPDTKTLKVMKYTGTLSGWR